MGHVTTSSINRVSSARAPGRSDHRGKHRPNPYLRMIMSLVCACALVGGEAALAQTVYSDTEFDVDNDWSSFGPFVTSEDATGAGFGVRQVLANGGQDAFLEVTLTRASVAEGGIGTWAAAINNTLIWDPAENSQGPVGKIDFRIDLRRGGGAWSLAVKQGEFVWSALAKRAIINALSPDTILLSIDCLDEKDFVALPGSEFVVQDQPLHPDFSANGAPISFGISVGLSCPASIDCSNISSSFTFDLDNLKVTVRSPFTINAGLNDAWFEPATAGQGFFHIVFPDVELIFLSWFTYDTERPLEDVIAILGEPGHRWLTALGPYVGDTAMLDIFLTQGGVFDQEEPSPGAGEKVGTITIKWCDCEKGKLAYDMPSLKLKGNIPLERLTLDNVALCKALL